MKVSSSTIDVSRCSDFLVDSRAGALVEFEGWVRNHNEGHNVLKLEYEVFVPIAEKEGKIVLSEAKEKFEIIDAIVVLLLCIMV